MAKRQFGFVVSTRRSTPLQSRRSRENEESAKRIPDNTLRGSQSAVDSRVVFRRAKQGKRIQIEPNKGKQLQDVQHATIKKGKANLVQGNRPPLPNL